MTDQPAADYLTNEFRVMGCHARLLLRTEESADVRALLADAEAELHRLNALLTRFQSTSELERLNDAGAGDVGPELGELLDIARRCRLLTGGRFTVGLGAQVIAAGYDRTFSEIDNLDANDHDAHRQAMIERGAHPTSALLSVEPDTAATASIDPYVLDGRHVTLAPGVRIDLGGIAKGWAADRIARGLARTSGTAALASLGGDVAVHVPEGGEPWPVSASVGGDERITLALAFGGMATSGWEGRIWKTDARGIAHHLIDPRTGQSAVTDIARITVIGSTCLEAEVWAKALLLVGSAAAAAEAETRGLTAIIVRADHACIRTGALATTS